MNDTYSKILVPYDGSKYSKRALLMATQLAKTTQAQMYIINVLDISQVKPPGRLFSRSEQKSLEQIKKSIKDAVKDMMFKIQQNCENSGVNTKSFVLEGLASEKLLQFIHQYDIDLVAIGSRGLSGISKIMTLGSVSRKISELADCPVMIVH